MSQISPYVGTFPKNQNYVDCVSACPSQDASDLVTQILQFCQNPDQQGRPIPFAERIIPADACVDPWIDVVGFPATPVVGVNSKKKTVVLGVSGVAQQLHLLKNPNMVKPAPTPPVTEEVLTA